MSDLMTGRKLADLSHTEIEELINLTKADKAQIIRAKDDDWEDYARGGLSLHPDYGVSHTVETFTQLGKSTVTYEELHFWEHYASVGETTEWDTREYLIRAGEVIGPWGDIMSPVAVVKWFLLHGFYFADESPAAVDVLRERFTQAARGFTNEHDDMHTDGSLMKAAMCYAGMGFAMFVKSNKPVPPCFVPRDWPWQPEDWKTPENPLRGYIIAAALIIAEIDRVERLINKPPEIMPEPPAWVKDAQAVVAVYAGAYASFPAEGLCNIVTEAGEGVMILASGADEVESWKKARAKVEADAMTADKSVALAVFPGATAKREDKPNGEWMIWTSTGEGWVGCGKTEAEAWAHAARETSNPS